MKAQGNSIYFFGAIHNSCKPSVKHRYSCFTTSSGGRCLPMVAHPLCHFVTSPHTVGSHPHSPPAREITSPNGRPSPLSLRDISPHCGESPLTPECRLRRFFIIYLKVNAIALHESTVFLDFYQCVCYNFNDFFDRSCFNGQIQ